MIEQSGNIDYQDDKNKSLKVTMMSANIELTMTQCFNEMMNKSRTSVPQEFVDYKDGVI